MSRTSRTHTAQHSLALACLILHVSTRLGALASHVSMHHRTQSTRAHPDVLAVTPSCCMNLAGAWVSATYQFKTYAHGNSPFSQGTSTAGCQRRSLRSSPSPVYRPRSCLSLPDVRYIDPTAATHCHRSPASCTRSSSTRRIRQGDRDPRLPIRAAPPTRQTHLCYWYVRYRGSARVPAALTTLFSLGPRHRIRPGAVV